MLSGPKVFGLYNIADLQRQPEVIVALERRSDICYFMDCSNVWFYGLHDNDLYVFDAATGELDCLGTPQSAIRALIQEWEDAQP